MSRSWRTNRGRFSGALTIVVLIGGVPSEAQEAIPRPTAGHARVRKALDEKTEFDFVERPLMEVAQAIGERHHIEVQLDRAALEDAGIETHVPITRRVKHIRLCTALRLLLRDLDLSYLVRDGYLLLTTESRAEELQIARFYPVGDFVDTNHGLWPPTPPSAKSKTARDDLKQLIDTITFAVAPSTWADVGGPGAIDDIHVSKALAVWQVEETHEEVAGLLAALRRVRDKQVEAARAIVGQPPPKADPELRLSIFRISKEPVPAKVVVPRFDGSMGVTPLAAGTDEVAKLDAASQTPDSRLKVVQPPICAESIAAALPELIEPETWLPKGPGVARAIGEAIVVRHTDDVRQRIAALLEELTPGQVVHQPPAARPPPLAVTGPRADWPQTAEPRFRTRGLVLMGTEEVDEAIERALAAPAEIDVADMPLGDVLNQLSERYGVTIQIDRKSLDEVGIGLDTPITRRIQDVPLSSLLHLLLDELNLAFLVFHGEAVLITAKVECESMSYVKVYPVFDLVCRAARDGDEGAGLDYQTLIDGVTTCVASTTWDDVGGPGMVKVFAPSGALVISQTMDIHEEIAQYLKALRDVAGEK